MILVKSWLGLTSNFFIIVFSDEVGFGVLSPWMFFRICLVCPFAMAMDDGRSFICSTISLVHVEKTPFLMAWKRVLQTGLNSVAWYHCANYGLVLYAMALGAAGHGGLGDFNGILVRLTFQMLDVIEVFPYSTVSPPFTKLR